MTRGNGIPAAAYVRISADPEGLRAGVERQRQDCQELAERLGYDLIEVFEDNDVSAFSGSPRPAYARMLKAIREGRVKAVVTWSADRLHRSPRELEDFIDLAEEHSLALANVGGPIDLATADGRAEARNRGVWARRESEKMSERLRRKHLELAEAGRWQGGSRRPFGYDLVGGRARVGTPVTIKPRKDEARHVRTAVRGLLAGTTNPTRIAREWNGAGVLTPGGYRWTPSNVGRTLTSAYLAGKREHGHRNGKGRVIVGTYPAEWPAIVSEDQHAALRAKLSAGQGRAKGPTALRYALTGLAECSECGRKLLGSGGAYRCQPRNGGCNKVRISADHLDGYVYRAILRWEKEHPKRGPEDDAIRPAEGEKELLAELRELREREAALAADIAEGILNRSTGYQAVEQVRAKVGDLEQQLAAALPAPRPRPAYWDRPESKRIVRTAVLEGGKPRGKLTPAQVQADHDWVAGWVQTIVVRPAARRGRYPADPGEVERMIARRVSVTNLDKSGLRKQTLG